jgi:vacuolar-type H+-ATPase subunit I/STV1
MKNLLNEIKAMNKIAGTKLTKEQEVALIKTALNEAVSSKTNKLNNLEKTREKLATELEKIDGELQELRMSISKEVTVTKKGKKTIYKRNSDGIEWYSPDSYQSVYWKMGDKFTDKEVQHDDSSYGNDGLYGLAPHLRKIALATYNGNIPKN